MATTPVTYTGYSGLPVISMPYPRACALRMENRIYKCSKVHVGAVTGDWMLEQFVERHDRSVGSSKITGQYSNSTEPQIEITCKTVRYR